MDRGGELQCICGGSTVAFGAEGFTMEFILFVKLGLGCKVRAFGAFPEVIGVGDHFAAPIVALE